MKLVLVLLALLSTLYAEHVRWQGDYEKARVEAQQEKKELLVMLMQPECPVCMKMLRSTFMDQEYISYINENYVAVLITKGQKQSYPIELLYTLEYPALFFLDSHELYTKDALFGYIAPKTLDPYLK